MRPLMTDWLWIVKAIWVIIIDVMGIEHRPPTAGNEPAHRWPFWPRFAQLLLGLLLYGTSAAFQVRSDLGLGPWDVLHQGLSRHTDLAIGTWSILVGAAVLLLWIPLRQRPGIGTVCNVVLIGLSLDAVLGVLPVASSLPQRWLYLTGGIVLCGVATGAYIGAGLGPGPRDGLMVGLAKRGHSLRVVRTSIELTVLIAGAFLGGTVGVGTVLYAVSIGPLAHLSIPAFTRDRSAPRDRRADSANRPEQVACASG
jgi:uncharacterized membrane protein YczE